MHFVVFFAAVRVLHDRHAATFEIDQFGLRTLEHTQGKGCWTCVEVMNPHALVFAQERGWQQWGRARFFASAAAVALLEAVTQLLPLLGAQLTPATQIFHERLAIFWRHFAHALEQVA